MDFPLKNREHLQCAGKEKIHTGWCGVSSGLQCVLSDRWEQCGCFRKPCHPHHEQYGS